MGRDEGGTVGQREMNMQRGMQDPRAHDGAGGERRLHKSWEGGTGCRHRSQGHHARGSEHEARPLKSLRSQAERRTFCGS